MIRRNLIDKLLEALADTPAILINLKTAVA
jgi:hypothetical protein